MYNLYNFTIIGSTYGDMDGVGNIAQFYNPNDVKSSPDGSVILVADYSNSLIRQITCTSGYNMSYGECIAIVMAPSSSPTSTIRYVSNIKVSVLITSQTFYNGFYGLCMDKNDQYLYLVGTYVNNLIRIELSSGISHIVGNNEGKLDLFNINLKID